MRIISGIYGGRKFNKKAPTGVRPTLDNVRESIFNILNNFIDFEGLNILDICAGTGALGFEALSRGAEYCTFVDKSKESCKYINEFAKYLNVENYQIHLDDAVKFLKNYNSQAFDLIFTDPPYIENFIPKMTDIISKNNILAENGIMIIEHGFKSSINYSENWQLISKKNYGITSIEIITKSIS